MIKVISAQIYIDELQVSRVIGVARISSKEVVSSVLK